MLPLYRYQGLVYRAHDPRWAFDPASGHGAAIYGGRFNKPGAPALYTSESIMGAITEAAQGLIMRLPPMTIVGYRVDHKTVLDLSTAAACRAAGVIWQDLACDWAYLHATRQLPPSWAISDFIQLHGAGGILAPSFAIGAANSTKNLVFWRWGEEPPEQVAVIDDYMRLPSDQRSWA